MPLTRRLFLLKLLGNALISLLGMVGIARAADPAIRQQQAEQSLRHFLDQLLPADEWSGSASELGVDRAIWQLADRHQRYRQFLFNGIDWLDQRAGGEFSRLSPQDAARIIEQMARANADQLPRRFFDNIRHTAVRFYYSDARSWQGLAINHPPQPIGYPELKYPPKVTPREL